MLDDLSALQGIRRGTNDEGEFLALIHGLKTCLDKGITNLQVQGDSMLAITMLMAEWKTNKEDQ